MFLGGVRDSRIRKIHTRLLGKKKAATKNKIPAKTPERQKPNPNPVHNFMYSKFSANPKQDVRNRTAQEFVDV